MVDDSAQLYTMEGIAAAFIILATAYLVAGTTSVYTPGDSHITDMQLEVLGNDVLAVMDTPIKNGDPSELEKYLSDWGDSNKNAFKERFSKLLNNNTGPEQDNLQFSTYVSYRANDDVKTKQFVQSQEMTGYEQAVRVTRLVTINGKPIGSPVDVRTGEQVVMVEVLIWRG
ncbi:hypothetical protein [uncultured Methanofollis sp.]|uniref:DUF7288 family protein n=1 Tax=uncultured Methanofollis sp. TaxID=262500 RepID=UPI00263533E2|nr:hypothetical protein [uncultured Methanofollis sp.]